MLVIGTGNRKKGEELAELLAPLGITVKTLADFPNAIEVVEDGDTFAENAAKKACQLATHLDAWVLADDSGLAVDALDGRPGVFSARYSGPEATDQSNNELLLKELGDLSAEKRTAAFVCHVVLSDPSGQIADRHEARCRGRILTQPQGTHGFGYDPLFELVEYRRSLATLGPQVKACLSHRARAMRMMLPKLGELAETALRD
jgi:XTP/dITP diphosphohydrolase